METAVGEVGEVRGSVLDGSPAWTYRRSGRGTFKGVQAACEELEGLEGAWKALLTAEWTGAGLI